MTRPIFVDTSAWCALFDRADRQHARAKQYWESMAGRLGLVYTSDFVLDETLTLLRMRLGHAAAVQFGKLAQASKVVQVIPVSASRWEHAWSIFVRFEDKDFSFTDCTSFAIMQELSLREAMAFDHHFIQMGFTLVP